uniref:Uncharacterized protein n=1 Tax=Romanomermis culicivorax TaxID=13658 RepID=A0A915KL66_ROMCU
QLFFLILHFILSSEYFVGKTLAGSDFVESAAVQITTVAKTGKGSLMDVPKLRGEASNVQSKGQGLKKGNLARQTQFTIDTSQAGDDILFIGILTSKGPCEEITIKHQGKGLFNVSYVVRERGISYIFVRYGSKDIPGSPFQVEVN